MNIKNKNGVTITVLVITIIVMIILFGITFSTSTDLLKNSQKNKMKTMLYMVQSRAEILLDDYLFDLDSVNPDYSKLAGEAANPDTVKNVGFESGITLPPPTAKVYRSWGKATLEAQGIDTKNLADGDTIIIQYNVNDGTVDVASTKGFSKDGVGIHKLSEF